MIQLNSTNTQSLNIILANTNKALNEVLKDIAPKELTTFSKTQDLGSMLESFMKDSSQNIKQNQELLTLVKNNPTLKTLGSVTTTLKDLQQSVEKILQPKSGTTLTTQEQKVATTLKEQPNTPPSTTSQVATVQTKALPALEKLQTFLSQSFSDISSINEANLQNKLENSGVFLESKLANFKAPTEDLKALTQDLSKLLDSSKLSDIQNINKDIKEILQTVSKTDINPKTMEALDKALEKLSVKIDSNIDKTLKPNDTLFKPEVKELQEKITQLNKPEQLQVDKKVQEHFSKDLKVIVHKSIEELQTTSHPQKAELIRQLDKLNLQIDYYQLLSHLSNSSAVYIPYSFDAVEDGNITIKNGKNKNFFCDIDLNLKEYGSLFLRLGLFDKKQLNINIQCESQELKKRLKKEMKTLRNKLFEVGIHPQDIRFLDDIPSQNHYNKADQDIALGFEVKA